MWLQPGVLVSWGWVVVVRVAGQRLCFVHMRYLWLLRRELAVGLGHMGVRCCMTIGCCCTSCTLGLWAATGAWVGSGWGWCSPNTVCRAQRVNPPACGIPQQLLKQSFPWQLTTPMTVTPCLLQASQQLLPNCHPGLYLGPFAQHTIAQAVQLARLQLSWNLQLEAPPLRNQIPSCRTFTVRVIWCAWSSCTAVHGSSCTTP